MYVVKAKNAVDNEWTTVYDSSDKALCLISQPKRSSEMNQPGSFDFTIYPDSDFYGAIVPMNTFISAFEGTDSGHLEETFYGRVLTCEDDFYGIKSVSCEGAFSFLKDATVGQVSTDENSSGREYQTSPQAFLQEQLTAYNAKVEDRKKLFYGGTSGITTSDAEIFKIDDDQDFRSVLESQLIDVYGGFFKITRLQNGTHELSYVKNYGINVGTVQMIQIGQNILDKKKHATGEGVFTFIRPVGKDGVRLDDGVYHGVACNSSNGRSGLYPVGTDAASFNALYARYGFIEKTKSFDDCENSAALANSCNSYVRDYGLDALDKLPMSFDVKLVDFFNANPAVKRIELGANYILTVDSEGRETGFEGHTDGTPAQEGQEGLTLTVYSINREYENPENDSIVFYNATYLTAKDYSIILSSMTGSYSSSSGGGGSRSGLSGYLSSSEAEIKEEQAEESRKVEKRFIDDEDSIGMVVTITENGKVINAGGIWTEITGTDKTLLQGTLDVDLVALRSGAIITAINNNEADGTSLTIDFDRLNITGSVIIDAINDDRTGTAAINANRIKLHATDTITLDAKLGIAANGLLKVNGGAIIDGNLFADGNLYLDDDLHIETGHTIQFNDGIDYVDYYPRDLRFGFGASGFVKSILSSSATEIAVGMEAAFDANSVYKLSFKENTAHTYNTADLTHYHNITATEGIGQDAGKILFTLGAPRSTEGTTNFNIAATQFYQDALAAGRIISANDNIVSGTLTVSSGSQVTLYPGHVIGGVTTKISDYALTVSAEDSAGYTRYFANSNLDKITSLTIPAGESRTIYIAYDESDNFQVLEDSMTVTAESEGGGGGGGGGGGDTPTVPDASSINLYPNGTPDDIFFISYQEEGSSSTHARILQQATNLGTLSSLMRTNHGQYGNVVFKATIDGGTGEKWYKVSTA